MNEKNNANFNENLVYLQAKIGETIQEQQELTQKMKKQLGSIESQSNYLEFEKKKVGQYEANTNRILTESAEFKSKLQLEKVKLESFQKGKKILKQELELVLRKI